MRRPRAHHGISHRVFNVVGEALDTKTQPVGVLVVSVLSFWPFFGRDYGAAPGVPESQDIAVIARCCPTAGISRSGSPPALIVICHFAAHVRLCGAIFRAT